MSYAGCVITVLEEAASPNLGIAGASVPPLPHNATYPYVTVQEIMVNDSAALDGPNGKAHTSIQINVWHKDYDVAWNVRKAIKDYLLRYKGTAGDLEIDSVTHGQEHALYDGTRELHQLILRLFIWWNVE